MAYHYIYRTTDFCWRHWQDGDVLLIFDDVVNYEDISDFLPPGGSRFKVLMTTRQKWLTQSFQRLELEVLDKDAALELLISFVGDGRIGGELEEAEALCNDLGFLPLGLELVARYLERKTSLSLAKTRERLGLEHRSLKVFSQDMTGRRGVAAAFELSWQELDEDDQELGCLLSLFASARIPWYLVEGCLPEVDEEELEDRRDDKLVNLSLLQSLGENCYEFHPLIREFFRNKNKLLEFDLVEEMKGNICGVIADAARKIPYDQYIAVEQVKEVKVDIPHITEVAENLAEYLSDDDLILPFISLGGFYHCQALYSLAQPWLERGREIAEKRRLDKNNADVIALVNIVHVYQCLAALYYAQGKYEAAEPLYLQIFEVYKIVFPENHPNIALSLNNLANLYHEQGKYEAAEPLYLQAIKIVKIAFHENHPYIALSLNNLAELYRGQGKYEAAEPLYLQAIKIVKIALPENHPNIAASLGSLAKLYYAQGKYEAAEPLLLQAIEIYKIALPENHPNIAVSLNNLTNLYYSQGKYEAAEPLLLQAIEIYKIALLENHPNIAVSLNNLTNLYYSQGKYEAAEPLLLQAIEIYKIALPENHPNIAVSLSNLAELYRAQGKYEAAEPLLLQAIEIYKIALPENHPNIAVSLSNLAELYRAQGKYEAGEPLLLQAIEIYKIALPENHPNIAVSLSNLAELYRAQGKYEAAEPLLLQAIEIFKQSLGEEHPHTQKVQENYQIFLNDKNN